ncbi:hypothetical protein BH24DEI2_BH24DEI2_26920 [soil metagenome]
MAAYVYLIEEQPHPGETSGPWTKIGYSQNPPEWRMNANLKRGNPRNIHVAAAFEYGTNQEARAAERAAHQQFGDYKHQKEWFNLAWSEIASWMEGSGAKLRV